MRARLGQRAALPRTVILFGAGASYGAGGIQPSAPPLGGNLFEEVARLYPRSWGGLAPAVRSMFEEQGFEAGMEWVWRNLRQAPQVLQKDLGHFFCRFCIIEPDANAYARLLRAIAERSAAPIVLATLNYEMVLEDAASTAGLPWNYGDVLAPGSRVLIVKPHGSCNFISGSIQVHNQSGHVCFDTGIRIDGRLRVLWIQDALAHCADEGMALGPAIVAFMAGKPAQICPSALADMQAAFRTAVMAAEKVAIVGVNPHVMDGHIWDCLAQTDAELVLCGDEIAFERWVNDYRAGRPSRYIGPRFAECVDQLTAFLA